MDFTDITNLATTAGIFVAAWQLYLSQRQATTAFEDAIAKEYRELAAIMPTKAFLGEELSAEEHKEYLDEFYHYFDLCNGQIFLRQVGRVRAQTWGFWRDGMKSNFNRPAFKSAWRAISEKANEDFAELRLLVKDFDHDPRSRRWRRELKNEGDTKAR